MKQKLPYVLYKFKSLDPRPPRRAVSLGCLCRGMNMTKKGGIRLVYVWAHCDGHVFAKHIEINCLDQRNHFVSTWLRCRSTMTACNDRRWVDSRSVVRLVEQVLLHEQEMCFPRSRAATVEMGNDRCVWVISQTTKTSTQRKPGAKSSLESSASVIPFVRWNRYHRQMYSTS